MAFVTGHLQFTVDIEGARELDRTLPGVLKRVSDWRPFFRKFLVEYRLTRVRLLRAEGAFDGEKRWPDLSAAYARWKAREYPGRTMLMRTGALARAASYPETSETAQQLVIAIANDYAIYHQSREPREKLPRRPLFSLTGREKTRMVGRLRRFIFDERAT